jgi:hypothetical protein
MNVPPLRSLAVAAFAFCIFVLCGAATATAQVLINPLKQQAPSPPPVLVAPPRQREIPRPLTTLDRVDIPAFLLGVDESGRLNFRTAAREKPTGDEPAATSASAATPAEPDAIEFAVAPADLVAWGSPPEPTPGTNIVLVDGSILTAASVTADSENLHAKLFGVERIVPLTQVRGVVFRTIGTRSRRERLFDAVAASRTGDRDRLVLLTGDETTGTVKSIDFQTVTLETTLGPAVVGIDKLSYVVFNPALAATAPTEKLRMLVGLRSGTTVVSTALRAAGSGRIALQPTALAPDSQWEVPATEITYLQTLGGKSLALSSLEPTGYRHIPFLDRTWQYRADRNVSGGSLTAGGRRYRSGLGMHSTSRITYALDGLTAGDAPPTRFAASLAIDDETDGRGSVTFRVFVDGEERYRSPVIRGGDRPTPIEVPLAGGKQLSLVVDFADFADEQDHADWLEARLLP